MKKIVIFSLLFNLIYFFSFGQKNLMGTYFNESGSKIEVSGYEFNYIEPHGDTPIWYNDTLAKCTLKWVDDNFIELNSVPSYIIAQQGLKVVQSLDSTIRDSIKVDFSIPYQRNNLDISVFCNSVKTFNLNYSKNSRELILPNDTKTITFSISPGIYLTPHSVDGLYYGVLYYSSAEYVIEKRINYILIEIPAIDDTFFEKYYVKGDYAKVSKDSITWKGEVFVKKSVHACNKTKFGE